ncbi:G-type lectin S-receptor-like serine/threonine-protein kinase SD2-5 [Euphorbia lathyris]|uniref:G-type lectin S-receptor-like serine/threonine-protein kinase SD2-5 n=1 Tax=Euphorbia lathyris TaxID=212925 RepID=UPI003313C979
MIMSMDLPLKWLLLTLFLIYFPFTLYATAWFNNDFIHKGSIDFIDGSTIRLILLNNTVSPATGCGFYGNRTTDSYFFSAFSVQTTSDSTIIRAVPPQLIWVANRANPVRENASLELNKNGDLVLNDFNGKFIWCSCNSTCKAALFNNSTTGNCSLPSQILSLITTSTSQRLLLAEAETFIKVQSPSSLPETPQSSKKNIRTVLVLVLFISASVAVVFIWICLRYIRNQIPTDEGRGIGFDFDFDEDCENSLLQVSNLPKRFTYKDLRDATDNFNKKLGGGGFGSVFEGTLINGTKIAVKCLDRFGQGRKEFLAEVKTIGNIHHVNLVRLAGFCAENSHKLLVYEYMINGSLDRWIFNPENTLEWKIRKKIIISIAKGISYLHEDCKMRIAHLDIKPQNILLDEKFDAKLSDFGLARLIDKSQSQIITQLRGTRGYMAPEWLSRKITEKVDVYSFGVVILETICGRKNLDMNKVEEDDMLLQAVVKRKAEEKRLFDLVDKCNDDMQKHVEEAVEMIRIAIWCLHNNPSIRPSMSMVVKALEGGMMMDSVPDYGFLTCMVEDAPAEVEMILSDPQEASILSEAR